MINSLFRVTFRIKFLLTIFLFYRREWSQYQEKIA